MKQVIYGNPVSKSNAYKIITINGHGSLAKSPELKKYENDFYIQCNHYRNKNIKGYFEIYVDVYFASQRSDLDNVMKVIMDCLERVKAIDNDNKLVKIVANKYLDKLNPRIEFELKEV